MSEFDERHAAGRVSAAARNPTCHDTPGRCRVGQRAARLTRPAKKPCP